MTKAKWIIHLSTTSLEDAIANQCLMHEIEYIYICTSECYRQKVQLTNIGHLVGGRYIGIMGTE